MSQISAPIQENAASASTRPADVIALTKPGIVRLVTITSIVGFLLAGFVRGWQTWTLIETLAALAWCVIGTALSAAGANALNQSIESRRDALMHRTAKRPIPAGRMSPGAGLAWGVGFSLVGVAVLWAGANPVAAIVSMITIILYVGLYTPMKPVTPLATWVGAIPGALPPLIGWASGSDGAWRGLDHPAGWSIFLIMFAWQIPHFLALAWKYREDYARGGHRVLTVRDPAGILTGMHALYWTVAMMAASLIPIWTMRGHIGWLYGASALVLGSAMLWQSLTLLSERNDRNARALFLGSVLYLPLVLFVMVGDAALGLLR